jgi:probable addiction module antidote protein
MARASKSYKEHLFEQLQTPEEVAAYVNAAMEEGDIALILLALRDVAEAWGIGRVAADADLNRENVYRILSSEGNPRLSSFIKLLHALEIELRVEVARGCGRKARAASAAATIVTPRILGGPEGPDKPEQYQPAPKYNRGNNYESSIPADDQPLAA